MEFLPIAEIPPELGAKVPEQNATIFYGVCRLTPKRSLFLHCYSVVEAVDRELSLWPAYRADLYDTEGAAIKPGDAKPALFSVDPAFTQMKAVALWHNVREREEPFVCLHFFKGKPYPEAPEDHFVVVTGLTEFQGSRLGVQEFGQFRNAVIRRYVEFAIDKDGYTTLVWKHRRIAEGRDTVVNLTSRGGEFREPELDRRSIIERTAIPVRRTSEPNETLPYFLAWNGKSEFLGPVKLPSLGRQISMILRPLPKRAGTHTLKYYLDIFENSGRRKSARKRLHSIPLEISEDFVIVGIDIIWADPYTKQIPIVRFRSRLGDMTFTFADQDSLVIFPAGFGKPWKFQEFSSISNMSGGTAIVYEKTDKRDYTAITEKHMSSLEEGIPDTDYFWNGKGFTVVKASIAGGKASEDNAASSTAAPPGDSKHFIERTAVKFSETGEPPSDRKKPADTTASAAYQGWPNSPRCNGVCIFA